MGEGMAYFSTIISAIAAGRLMRKGCEAFLAHVVGTRKTNSSLQDIPTICDFLDVFLEELPGLPPDREVEFAIEVMLGTTPISIAPYKWHLLN